MPQRLDHETNVNQPHSQPVLRGNTPHAIMAYHGIIGIPCCYSIICEPRSEQYLKQAQEQNDIWIVSDWCEHDDSSLAPCGAWTSKKNKDSWNQLNMVNNSDTMNLVQNHLGNWSLSCKSNKNWVHSSKVKLNTQPHWAFYRRLNICTYIYIHELEYIKTYVL